MNVHIFVPFGDSVRLTNVVENRTLTVSHRGTLLLFLPKYEQLYLLFNSALQYLNLL